MPELVLSIGAEEDADQPELAELTAWLREELLELDVESVESIKMGEIPAGAKGLEAIGIGAPRQTGAVRRHAQAGSRHGAVLARWTPRGEQ